MAPKKKRGGRAAAPAKSSGVDVGRKTFSTEELIVRVQLYPQLYDKGHTLYKDPSHTRLVWFEIAEHFFAEHWYTTLQDAEKEELMLECKTRWRSVKDAYIKDLKLEIHESRSGSGLSKRKPYKFAQNMEFLRPCVELRNTEDNLTMVVCDSDSESTMLESVGDCTISDTPSPSTSETQSTSDRGNTASKAASTASRSIASEHTKKKSKKSDSDELLTSLKSVMNVMEREKNPAYTLAISLIPLIETVPKGNMFRLRHALIDTIQSCVSEDTEQAPTTAPPPMLSHQVPTNVPNVQYSHCAMPRTSVYGGESMGRTPNYPYQGIAQSNVRPDFEQVHESQHAPYMQLPRHAYSPQYMHTLGAGDAQHNRPQQVGQQHGDMSGQGATAMNTISSSLTESLYLTDL
ncbi:uncharacterized protein [Hyperolius riggenbachi]|uniref:uncharacterized protein n=1 Tax=Hyperolius riggenbachi TaxID=752182 RepID=UPI0035A3C54E